MRARSVIPVIASVLCLTLGGLLLSDSTALASFAYGPTVTFGDGLNGPTAVAVDDATGEVYVADTQNNRVEVFNADAEYLGEFSGSEDPSKGLVQPTWIAVDNSRSKSDPSAGDVYVADSGEGVIEKFKPLGGGKVAYVSRFPTGTETPLSSQGGLNGVAVDDATGGVYVYTGNGNVFQFTDGETNGEVQVWQSNVYDPHDGIAVNEAGDLFLAAREWWQGLPHLEKFSPEGAVGDLSYNNDGEVTCGCVTGVAMDEAIGQLVVEENGTTIKVEGKTLGASFLSNGGGNGVAQNEANGNVYVVNSASNQVAAFPAIELSSAPTVTDVEARSATVHGMVNGNGTEVDYQVEYGLGGSLGLVSPRVDAGSGESSVEVPLTDLTAGATYEYRIVATTSQGSYYSETESFITPPEVAGTEHAFRISSFGATLSGTIDNPGNLDPNYHFVYGLEKGKYEYVAPVIEGLGAAENENQPVSWRIGGEVGSPEALLPGRKYYFALVGTNVGGAEAIGPEEEFTTLPYLPPIIEAEAAQGIGETAATLAGAINAQSLKTVYFVEYGVTAGYGSTWPTIEHAPGELPEVKPGRPPIGAASAGEGAGPAAISIYVQNLQPGTLYHYRIVASNEDGVTYGPDETFTTEGYPISIVPETPRLSTSIGIQPPEKEVITKKGKGKKGSKGHKKATKKAKSKKGKGKK